MAMIRSDGAIAEPTGASPEQRRDWPFATLLPWSVMYNYPPPQFMTPTRAPRPSEWPPQPSRRYRAWQARTTDLAEPLHQIYVHVPFCPFLCDYCPFYKVKSTTEDVREQFTRALIREIELYGQVEGMAERTFSVLYFGGGTPTELSSDQLGRIIAALRANLNLAPDVEITLEGVARQMLSPGYLEACFAHGVNRLSFGIQSLDEKVRKAIGRTGDKVEDYRAAIEAARSVDPNVPVNVELLHGCPDQSDDSVINDIETVLSWEPASIDLFSYIMLPGTPLYRKVLKGSVAQPRYGQHLLTQRRRGKAALEAAGYRQMAGEMFKRTADRGLFSKSFYGGRGNATHTILPLGPSAIGHVNGISYRNSPSIHDHRRMVEAGRLPIGHSVAMSAGQARRRALLLALANLEIPERLVETARERRCIARWLDHGLVEPIADGWAVTAEGTLWYNQMQIELLPLRDFLKNTRLLGSLEEQYQLLRGDTPLGKELLAMASAYGGGVSAALMLTYRGYLGLMTRVSGAWSQGAGWLGPAKRTQRN